MNKARIVHFTTVHHPGDPRIFLKMATSLQQAGYPVKVVAPQPDSPIDAMGLPILFIRRHKSKWARVILGSLEVLRICLEEKADIYHFHDPELIPMALALKLITRRAVVYDVHEDYITAIKQKNIPFILKPILELGMRALEKIAKLSFEVVIAEKYYRNRFPKATAVLNYPLIKETQLQFRPYPEINPPRLLYTGNITQDRGALNHAALSKLNLRVDVFLVGKCSDSLLNEINVKFHNSIDQIHLIGGNQFVPYDLIQSYYMKDHWLAGLAIFDDTPHYKQKELTKFFEYMQYGLPIIASNFKAWRELIEENDIGVCVDPNKPETIKTALYSLINDKEGWIRKSENAIRLSKEYTWESQFRKLEKLYENL